MKSTAKNAVKALLRLWIKNSDYDKLTDKEKELVNPDDFEQITKWIGRK